MRSNFVATLVLSAAIFTACAGKIEPVEIPEEDSLKARQLMFQGDALFRDGKDHLALLKYVESSTLNPYSQFCFNRLAITYGRVLMFTQAQKAVNRAVRLDPGYADGYNTRGSIQVALGKYDAAIGSFKNALRHSPQNPVFHLNFGRAHLLAGHYEKSRSAFQAALELNPDALALEGTIALSASDRQENVESFYKMARVFAEHGDAASCLYFLDRALAKGFKDRERLQKDKAFEQLRSSRAFIDLVAR